MTGGKSGPPPEDHLRFDNEQSPFHWTNVFIDRIEQCNQLKTVLYLSKKPEYNMKNLFSPFEQAWNMWIMEKIGIEELSHQFNMAVTFAIGWLRYTHPDASTLTISTDMRLEQQKAAKEKIKQLKAQSRWPLKKRAIIPRRVDQYGINFPIPTPDQSYEEYHNEVILFWIEQNKIKNRKNGDAWKKNFENDSSVIIQIENLRQMVFPKLLTGLF